MKSDKEYSVIVSERAKQMLALHIRFMAQVNKKAATEQKNKILSALKTLKKMPSRFPFFDAQYIPANKYHMMFIEKWYIVLYQIKDETVYVEYILDCRKDYDWLI